MTTKVCRKCGTKPLPEHSGRGRPSVYCSTGCRRAAEYELKRAQRALEGVEGQIASHREHLALYDDAQQVAMSCCLMSSVKRHLDVLQEERHILEARLIELLDDEAKVIELDDGEKIAA
jgi:hypothetical protein